MFERPDPTFEPSSTTREAMLFVRTRPVVVAGVKHPGYFGNHNYTGDWVLFILALCLEALGLYAIYSVLNESEVSSFSAAAFIAGSLFVLDLVLAIVHHRFSSGINSTLEIQSMIAARKGGPAGNISSQNNLDRLAGRKRVAFSLSLLLVVVAGIKFALVYFLNPNDVDGSGGMLVFLAIAYPVTAIIHIRTTGYLLHAVWAAWLHSRDVEAFKKSNGVKNKISDTPHTIELAMHDAFRSGFRVDEHEIKTIPASETIPEQCFLLCKGLLFDVEIERFGNQIHDESARTEFVFRAMELQTRMASARV